MNLSNQPKQLTYGLRQTFGTERDLPSGVSRLAFKIWDGTDDVEAEARTRHAV